MFQLAAASFLDETGSRRRPFTAGKGRNIPSEIKNGKGNPLTGSGITENKGTYQTENGGRVTCDGKGHCQAVGPAVQISGKGRDMNPTQTIRGKGNPLTGSGITENRGTYQTENGGR